MLLNQLLPPFFRGEQKPSIFSDQIWLVAWRARKGEILTQIHVIVMVYSHLSTLSYYMVSAGTGSVQTAFIFFY